MSSLSMTPSGFIEIPKDLRDRYHFAPGTPIRVVETTSGILLVPLSDEPMDAELKKELEEWQALGAEAWAMFPYEENEP